MTSVTQGRYINWVLYVELNCYKDTGFALNSQVLCYKMVMIPKRERNVNAKKNCLHLGARYSFIHSFYNSYLPPHKPLLKSWSLRNKAVMSACFHYSKCPTNC
jgi:hypothetical protein